MYANTMTDSMKNAINETNRRRKLQQEFNEKHGIVPKTIRKDVREVIEATKMEKEIIPEGKIKDVQQLIETLRLEMKQAAKQLQFERAAVLRDKIEELSKL